MEDSAYIKRLKERLRQKPDSKLFLSFAEELRRKDRIDEAIAALLEGIKKNPEFITAHLALGRWYLSSDMLPEAKKEFLEAAGKSPDNIFARKGLAKIYKRMGEEESAAEEYKKIFEINPLDKDAAAYLAATGYSLKKPEALEIESKEAEVVFESQEEAEVLESPSTITTRSKKEVVDRLNLFLEAVKNRFAVSKKAAVKDRLSRMLKAINIRFAAPPPAAPSYKD
ncbi:MAG: hypothetical protein HY957_04305 [Nitrospirae bacterium]|nr:hypothetical protein [Nitrospirota bacterium]